MEKINKIIEVSITALYDAVFSGKITNHKDLIEIGTYLLAVKASGKNECVPKADTVSIKSEVPDGVRV